jgi:hypothetical protein
VETFVVRVFVATDANAVPFCGVVERAGTGRAETFQSAQDLIQIVAHELERDRLARATPTFEQGEGK